MEVEARKEVPEADRPVVEALVTVKTLVLELKVKLEEVAMGLVPLPKRMSLAVMDKEPVPPLATGRIPVTLVVRSIVEFKMSELVTRPLNKGPAAHLTSPVPKELKVVEPLEPTVNKEVPEEEATIKTSKVGEVEVPTIDKVALGVVVPMPTLWLAVTLNTEIPVEEEMLKGSIVPTPLP